MRLIISIPIILAAISSCKPRTEAKLASSGNDKEKGNVCDTSAWGIAMGKAVGGMTKNEIKSFEKTEGGGVSLKIKSNGSGQYKAVATYASDKRTANIDVNLPEGGFCIASTGDVQIDPPNEVSKEKLTDDKCSFQAQRQILATFIKEYVHAEDIGDWDSKKGGGIEYWSLDKDKDSFQAKDTVNFKQKIRFKNRDEKHLFKARLGEDDCKPQLTFTHSSNLDEGS
jgi:hypothetical protein